MTAEKVQVARIEIRNVLGIEDCEIEPGSVTVLEGRNGSGKTSILTAIRKTIGGGHAATLIRHGAEAGEVVLVLEDGTTIRNRITEKASRLTVKDPAGNTIKGPKRYLDALRDALSLNPIEFVDAKPADRLKLLAKAVPAEYDRGTIEAAAGIEIPPHVNLTGGALEMLGTAEAWFYERRHAVGVELRNAKETVDGLRSSLEGTGEDDAEAVKAELADLRQRRDDCRSQREATVQAESAMLSERVDRDRDLFAAVQKDEQAKLDDALEAAREAYEAAKAKAHQEFATTVERAREEFQRTVAVASAQLAEVTAAADTTCADALAVIEPAIGAAEERLEGIHRAAGTRKVYDATQAKAKELGAQHDALEAAVEAVRGLRDSLLASLPIKDLSVRDGEVWYGDFPWPNLEESRRVWIAVQVAMMRSGKLGLICVDGLEALDAERFEMFTREIIEAGGQMIGARVGDGDLEVTAPGTL